MYIQRRVGAAEHRATVSLYGSELGANGYPFRPLGAFALLAVYYKVTPPKLDCSWCCSVIYTVKQTLNQVTR